jgi:aryl-alcohol dehydrogenase-like predicted oxidoreductase
MPIDLRQQRPLGSTGLIVGRLGLASSYGAPAAAYEMAFERGCNYFYWGSLRRDGMGEAIRTLAPRRRENLVVVLQSYSRWGMMLSRNVESGLRRLGLDYADILLLGWHNKPLSARLMEAAVRLKERGKVRHFAVSGHHRPMFAQHAADQRLEVMMVRYNAAHRGAEAEVFAPLRAMKRPKPGLVSYTATRWGTLLDARYTPAEHATPTAADCYRFVLSNPEVDLCLTGPATSRQMEENLHAIESGPMSDEEMNWMREVGDHVHARTAKRSPNPFMQRTQ